MEVEEQVRLVERRFPPADSFRVGVCVIRLSQLAERISDLDRLGGKGYGIDVDCNSLHAALGRHSELGIEFTVWLSKQMDKMRFETAVRDISAVIRSYLREVLAHCRSIQESLEGEE